MSRRLLCALAALCLIPATVSARTCELAVDSDDSMRFAQSELSVAPGCTQVRLSLRHAGRVPASAMGHNWVLTRTADYRPVAIAGARAGLAGSYVPAGDARVLAHTRVIGGGESTSITFATAGLQRGGDYTFFCSFPGHWNVMRGKLVVQ